MNVRNGPIYGLELLRGLCALAVAVFHTATWSDVAHLPTWGLYGVYIFFVISGAVMYYNYHAMNGPGGIPVPTFLYKRFARLAPLFVLCVAMTAVLMHEWPLARQILNASMLFGFSDPGRNSLVTGGWSLGIEFVLYVLFPVLLAFTVNLRVMLLTLAALFALRIISAELALEDRSLVEAWAAYTQPGAFLVFFFGGMALARINGFRHQWLLGLAAIPMFLFVGSSEESVLQGWRGVGYSLAAIVLVGGFFWSPRNRLAVAICRFLGDASYGLYLLHPIVWLVVRKFLPQAPVAAHIVLTLSISMVGAWLSLRLYERPVKNFLLRKRAPVAALST